MKIPLDTVRQSTDLTVSFTQTNYLFFIHGESKKNWATFLRPITLEILNRSLLNLPALFSKVDLIKLWHDVQNEETLICAKFGKDRFNISKVIGGKKVAQFDSQCRVFHYTVLKAVTIL